MELTQEEKDYLFYILQVGFTVNDNCSEKEYKAELKIFESLKAKIIKELDK